MSKKTVDTEGALKLVDIHKTYIAGENKVQALKGVDLEFRKSEFVAILGPSGCGKTTLLNIIGGLDRYTSGDLIIGGKSTKNFNDKDWDAYRNNSIGFVFQNYNLIPHQTVLENVELSLELSGVHKKERRERALELLKKVGLESQGNKKPNQLSGGQMQRVAIARALINNPQIILADEPTGALDTETSVQVMDILKEISKERLVIMVTHNPDLADKYSTRIIRLLDGKVTDDTNPFAQTVEPQPKVARKPKMGLKTAFGLSLKNLISKRARTMLTSFAGSIGIIGVALVLALSNGFNIYMARMQTDSLSSYPLTISETSIDLAAFGENLNETGTYEKYPELDNVFVKKAFSKLTGMLKPNDLTNTNVNSEGVTFKQYLDETPKEYYYAISYQYGFDINDYIYSDMTLRYTDKNDDKNPVSKEYTPFVSINMLANEVNDRYSSTLAGNPLASMGSSVLKSSTPTFTEMPNSVELIKEQYDVLYGTIPEINAENSNKLLLVVDNNNGISDMTLGLLGYLGLDASYKTVENKTEWTVDFFNKNPAGSIDQMGLEDIVGENAKKFYLANNSLMFNEEGGRYYFNYNMDKAQLEELEVVGIVRAKENVTGILSTGLVYQSTLTQKILEQNKNSDIVGVAQNSSFGMPIFSKELNKIDEAFTTKYQMMTSSALAGKDTPSSINIYAKDFEGKTKIKERLEAWNGQFEDGDSKIIAYSDMMDTMFGMLGTMVDAVTYVLIAFTSVSLLVSSVMISIITYTSVVERTKEIGVLRALGASKGEISRVFNAETFLIGLFSGLIGVGVTYLFSIPINLLLGALVPQVGNLANLSPLSAVILVAISIGLTLLAGLIPSRIASKKDPVVALRTE